MDLCLTLLPGPDPELSGVTIALARTVDPGIANRHFRLFIFLPIINNTTMSKDAQQQNNKDQGKYAFEPIHPFNMEDPKSW